MTRPERKNIAYLKRYSDIIEKVAEKNEVDSEKAGGVIIQFFDFLKDSMGSWKMPKIRVPYFGVFAPTRGKIEAVIRRCVSKAREVRDEDPEKAEKYRRRIRYLWMIRRRLLDEKAGKETYREWLSKEKPEHADQVIVSR